MMRLVATVSALLLLNSGVSAQSDSSEQVNLALNRGAFTSQISDAWPAAYAVDGRPSEDLKSVPDPGIPSCSHTAVAGDVDRVPARVRMAAPQRLPAAEIIRFEKSHALRCEWAARVACARRWLVEMPRRAFGPVIHDEQRQRSFLRVRADEAEHRLEKSDGLPLLWRYRADGLEVHAVISTVEQAIRVAAMFVVQRLIDASVHGDAVRLSADADAGRVPDRTTGRCVEQAIYMQGR